MYLLDAATLDVEQAWLCLTLLTQLLSRVNFEVEWSPEPDPVLHTSYVQVAASSKCNHSSLLSLSMSPLARGVTRTEATAPLTSICICYLGNKKSVLDLL